MRQTHFFFNDTATTEIYTLSLHDALPIYQPPGTVGGESTARLIRAARLDKDVKALVLISRAVDRSEEHTSELQSQSNLVCRLLLEKKKQSVGRAHIS